MADEQEPTRAELKRQLAEANALLEVAKRKADGRPAGEASHGFKGTPYTGFVRAIENCHDGAQFRWVGDVFHVENVVLWTDDPFEPVIAEGEFLDEQGVNRPKYVRNPNAPTPNNFRLRPKSEEVLKDPSPRMAKDY